MHVKTHEIENVQELTDLAQELKYLAAKETPSNPFEPSKNLKEFFENMTGWLNNMSESEKTNLACGTSMRRVYMDNIGMTFGLTVEAFSKDDLYFHLSISQMGMPPMKVPDIIANKITDAFFPEGFEEKGPMGIMKNIRHFFQKIGKK